MKEKKMPKTYKGKSTRKGGGGHFAMVTDAIMKTGKSKDQAEAIAASQGRKKYGKEEFQHMAKVGKKRASALKTVMMDKVSKKKGGKK